MTLGEFINLTKDLNKSTKLILSTTCDDNEYTVHSYADRITKCHVGKDSDGHDIEVIYYDDKEDEKEPEAIIIRPI